MLYGAESLKKFVYFCQIDLPRKVRVKTTSTGTEHCQNMKGGMEMDIKNYSSLQFFKKTS